MTSRKPHRLFGAPIVLVAALIFLGSIAPSASAQSCPLGAVTWDGGAGTQSWFDPLNWSTNSLPSATDEVCLQNTGSAYTVQHRSWTTSGGVHFAGATIEGLTIEGGAGAPTLDVKSGFFDDDSDLIDGTGCCGESTLTVDNAGGDAQPVLNGGTLRLTEDTMDEFGNNSKLSVAGGEVDNNGTLELVQGVDAGPTPGGPHGSRILEADLNVTFDANSTYDPRTAKAYLLMPFPEEASWRGPEAETFVKATGSTRLTRAASGSGVPQRSIRTGMPGAIRTASEESTSTSISRRAGSPITRIGSPGWTTRPLSK